MTEYTLTPEITTPFYWRILRLLFLKRKRVTFKFKMNYDEYNINDIVYLSDGSVIISKVISKKKLYAY